MKAAARQGVLSRRWPADAHQRRALLDGHFEVVGHCPSRAHASPGVAQTAELANTGRTVSGRDKGSDSHQPLQVRRAGGDGLGSAATSRTEANLLASPVTFTSRRTAVAVGLRLSGPMRENLGQMERIHAVDYIKELQGCLCLVALEWPTRCQVMAGRAGGILAAALAPGSRPRR